MKIKLNLYTATLLLILFISHDEEFFILLISATIHELGHITVARLLKIDLKELRLDIFGAGLSCDTNSLSYRNEILLCLGGPFANLFSAILCSAFLSDIASTILQIKIFFSTSLFLALINLLPIKGFDGGRVFYSIIANTASPKVAAVFQKITSFLLIFIMWSFSLFLLIKYSFSLSMFIFSLSLFVKIFMSDLS